MKKKEKAKIAAMVGLSAVLMMTGVMPVSANVYEESIPRDFNRYFSYMLSQIKENENAVFSPESFEIAAQMYSLTLDETGAEEFRKFLGSADRLNYVETDALKMVNRVWVNENMNFTVPDDNPLAPLIWRMDISDETAATKEKNDFVAKQTDDFITETPSVLGPTTVADFMNVLYFKDTWYGGDKWLEVEEKTFTNADGSTAQVHMLRDYGSRYYFTDNAISHSIKYNSGATFTVILPDEGVDLADVDLNAFISGEAEFRTAEINFFMPEFETDSRYDIRLSDLLLPDNSQPDAEINSDLGNIETKVAQAAKIRVDHEGTEAAAVTELVMDTTALPPEEEIDFICDRPFIYYIRDVANDDIMFIGVVNIIK